MAKLKYILTAILALALTLCLHTSVIAEAPAQLTEKGHQLLEEGQPEEAYKTWEKALERYEDEQNATAILGTKINQSLALSAMGQNPRACSTLAIALEFEDWICDTQEPPNNERLNDALNSVPNQPVTILAIHSLANTLQGLGKTEEAIVTLKNTLQKASTIEMDATPIQLSLANAYTSFYRQKLNQYQLSTTYRSTTDPDQSLKASSQAALSLYQFISEHSGPTIALKAKLNQLELSQELDPTIPQLKELEKKSKAQIPLLIKQISQADFNLLCSFYCRY